MKLKTKASTLVLLILLQSASIIFLTHNKVAQILSASFLYDYPIVLVLFFNILGIAAIINVFYVFSFFKREQNSMKKLNHSKEVIEALRGQKHDFNNHMNVVGGMIGLKKYDRALKYIYNICGKTNEIFSISKIENVEVAAILYRKVAIAENKGITVEIDISTSLEDLSINSIDLSKIFFNLLDNAIYELELSPYEEKILTVDIKEDDEKFIIIIGNSYPVLSPELFDKIFIPGYTTKKGQQHGYGLDIIKKTVEKNKGQINVESYEGIGTLFTVFLPKSTKASKIYSLPL